MASLFASVCYYWATIDNGVSLFDSPLTQVYTILCSAFGIIPVTAVISTVTNGERDLVINVYTVNVFSPQ